jgi:hypothetical protein
MNEEVPYEPTVLNKRTKNVSGLAIFADYSKAFRTNDESAVFIVGMGLWYILICVLVIIFTNFVSYGDSGSHSIGVLRSTETYQFPMNTPMDDMLINREQSVCSSVALHFSGRWRGPGSRTFGLAERRGLERSDKVAQLQSYQKSEYHDFVQSCKQTLLQTNQAPDYSFAKKTCEDLNPPEYWNETSEVQTLYALGKATGYGGEPIFHFQDELSPNKRVVESLFRWDVGAMVRQQGLTSTSTLTNYFNQSCYALDIIGMRKTSQEDCLASVLSKSRWLIQEFANAPELPVTDFVYSQNQFLNDTYSHTQLTERFGFEAVEAFLNGILSSYDSYEEFLIAHGYDKPQVKYLPHWIPRMQFVQNIMDRFKTESSESWIQFIRVSVLMDGMKYTTALLHPEYRNAPNTVVDHLSRPEMTEEPASRAIGYDARHAMWHPPRVPESATRFPEWVLQRKKASETTQNVYYVDEPVVTELMNSALAERCIWLATQHLPEHVARFYRDETLTPEWQEVITETFHEVRNAMIDMIYRSMEWSDSGKRNMVHKLSKMKLIIGAPDVDPSLDLPFKVSKGASFLEVAFVGRQKNMLEGMLAISKGKHKVQMMMETHKPNAYYDPRTNTFTVLAGIAQFPFTDPKWSRSSRLATIGAIIGHEMAHALDEMGSYFDEDGEHRDIFPATDRDLYNLKTKCFEDQYSSYPTPFHGNTVDGKKCVNEIMADVIGAQAALHALESGKPISDEVLREFVGSYTQMWADSVSGENEQRAIEHDVHPPAGARQDGTVRNLVDIMGTNVIQRLYRCSRNSLMVPVKMCALF